MNKEDIEREFEKFNISPDRIPHYETTAQFAGVYKRCSLYEYFPVTYTASAIKDTAKTR